MAKKKKGNNNNKNKKKTNAPPPTKDDEQEEQPKEVDDNAVPVTTEPIKDVDPEPSSSSDVKQTTPAKQ